MYAYLHGLGMRHTAYRRSLRAVEQQLEIFLGFMLKHTSKTNHYRTTRKSLYPKVYPLFADFPQTTPYRPLAFPRAVLRAKRI